MSLRARYHAGLARQLGHPQGIAGRVVGARLDRRNARAVRAAVQATHAGAGAVVADLGFGGGGGLSLLLDRVGPPGTVHGVEISEEMLTRARGRYEDAVSAGRLVLHAGSLQRLPLEDGSIDGLVTTNTVYFVDDIDAVFAELARVLAPSGRAAVGVADPDAMAKMPFTTYGFRIRPVEQLLEAARAAGLELREHDRLGGGPRPFHILVFGR
jgi:ubiquinone/menaquinone biosynthesis C-methylase UbiE